MDEKLECEVDVERTVDMREKRYTVFSTVVVDEPMGETTTWHQASAPLPSFLTPEVFHLVTGTLSIASPMASAVGWDASN